MGRRTWLVAIVCGALIICVGIARGGGAAEEPRAVKTMEMMGEAINRASAQARASVVRVSTKREITIRPPAMSEDIRRRLQRQLPRQREIPRELGERRTVTRRDSGCGVILDEEGHVLTCNHVVSGAGDITVTTDAGRTLDATVVGTDVFTDTAVLKVEANGLRPATLGDSEALYAGQPVVSFQWPDGLDNAVSFGIVSAVHQRFGAAPLEDFIQFDASVVNGGAGGPLINLRGQVVALVAGRLDGGAVATTVESDVSGEEGVPGAGRTSPVSRVTEGPIRPAASGAPGFAIPINMIKDILDALKAGEEVQRGFLGIYGKDVTFDVAERLDYDGTAGAVVEKVMDDSPAREAGLEKDDVIVSANGKEMDGFQQFRTMLARAKPGDVFTLEVWSDGRRRTVKVTLGERPGR